MATKFQIKRSSVSGRTPNTTNSANSSYIAAGELALNLTDKKMYSSNGTNYFEIGSFKVELVNSTSNVSTFTEISTLQFDENSGFDVTNPSSGIAKVAINSTFKFWQVDGVQKLTATGLDTVNFIGGNNISITANGANTPQSIAFATSMTPTFTSVTFGNSTVNTTINSSAIAVTKIFANGVTGSAGQVLSANSTGGIYWETSAGGTGILTVTSDTFNGNGSNTIFTLSTSSTTDRSFVYLNGVQQAPTTDYTISGTTLTFVVAPPSDNVIEVRSFDIPSIADITVTTDTFTANGTQTNFTLSTPDSSVTNSLVFLNGVTQVPTTDYTLSSTTLTFLSAPVNGTAVQAISFTSAGVKSAAFTGNGSNTQFTLPVISTTSKTIVAINGVTQTPVTDYSVSGTTLIFAVAPINNDNILVRVLPSKVDSAGGNTQIQYNKSGSLGGSAGFTFNETTNNVTIANTLTVPNFILNASNPPANSTSTGTTGTFAWDSSFFYIATGTNTWKKTPITTDGAGGGGGGSGSPGGSNTHIQYNDSSTFNGSAAFTFNESTNTVTLSNTLAIGSNVTVNTSTIFIGNSSVNTTITAGNVHLQGTQLTVGNTVLTGEQITVGNSIVNSSAVTVGNSTVNTTIAGGSIVTNGFLTVLGATTLSNTLTAGNTTITGLASVSGNLSAGNITSLGNLVVEGNLTVNGTSVSLNSVNLKITDNIIFLNEPEVSAITGASSNGTHFLYVANNGFTVGMSVRVTGVSPSGYNVTDLLITFANTTHFAVANTDTPGAYSSGGSVEARADVNPDLGWTGEYNDGAVRHSGFFRDASDSGRFKIFDNYSPEPDGPFINTGDATFRIANFQANDVLAATFSGNGANITSINATSISTGTLDTARLPATVNVSTAVNVGANVKANTSALLIGNSTVNSLLTSTELTVGTSVYVVANGNVGINTATPGAKLDVSGTAKFTTVNSTRIDPRVSSTTSTSSITPDVSAFDQYCVTAQAATLTFEAPIGTPVDGNRLLFRILDNGTPQTINWNATYTAMGAVLPTLTTANKMIYVGCIYNAADTRWDVIAVTQQA